MKYVIILLVALMAASSAKSQGFPGTDSLRGYNSRYVTTNPATAFTNNRLNTLLRGIIDWIDTARAGTGGGGAVGVDTLHALNDSTVRYRSNGTWKTFILEGVYDTRRKVDTAYALNDSTLQIKINGTNRNIILPGRHWNLQGVLNNGSTLTENENIVLADSLEITSGIVVIDSLRLRTLSTTADTSTYKPLAVGANGRPVKFSHWPGGPPALTSTQIGYGSGSNELTSEAAFNYNATTNTLTVDSLNLNGLTASRPLKLNASKNVISSQIDLASANDITGILPAGNTDTSTTNSLTTKHYVNNPTRWPHEEVIGEIYHKNTWNNLTDFAPNTSGSTTTLALNSGYVDYSVSSIAWSNYTTILPNRATILPNWSISVVFKMITAPGAGTVGFGLGTHKAIGGNGDVLCFINTTTSGSGTLAICRGDGALTWATGSSFTVNQNDVVRLTVTFVDSVITFSANNLTGGGSGSINYTNTLASTTAPLSLISNWALVGHSSTACTWQVQDVNITSQTKRNANLVLMGDSKTQGAFATYFATRYGTRLNSSYPTAYIYASGNATIADFLNLLQEEIGDLNGRQYLLSLGSNDKRGGATLAQMQDRYTKLVKLLEGGGARVTHIVIPEDSTATGVGLTDFKNWVAATYASNYIDVWTQLSTSNVLKDFYDSGDGIHPNEAANKSIDSLIVLSGKVTTNPTNRRQAYRVGGGLIELYGDSITTKPFDKRENYVNHWDATGASRTGLLQDNGTSAGISATALVPITGNQFTVTGFLGINGATGGLIFSNRNGPLTDGRYSMYASSDEFQFFDIPAGAVRMSLKSTGNLVVGNVAPNGAKLQVDGDATVTDEAYDATAWNENPEVPTKNAIRDKFEAIGTGQNISNASLTANGSYTQDWNHFPLTFNNINQWSLDSKEDATTLSRKIRQRFYTSNAFSSALNLTTSVRNAADNADSVIYGFRNFYSGSSHLTGLIATDGSETGTVDVGLRSASISATRSGKNGTVSVVDGKTTISASDSIVVKGAVLAASADSVFAGVRNGSDELKVLFVPVQRTLKGTTNWTPGIVAAGSSTSTTVSVTGAAVGDPVTICKLAAYSNGEVYDAFVSATNTVTIRVHNVSTGSANYSSAADYNVIVLKY